MRTSLGQGVAAAAVTEVGATEVAEPVGAMVEGAEVGPVEEVEATVAGTTAVEE